MRGFALGKLTGMGGGFGLSGLAQLIVQIADLLSVVALVDLDHGLHIQDQVQTVSVQLAVGNPLAAPTVAIRLPVHTFGHAVAGQCGDQEYRLAADIIVGHSVDGFSIQLFVVLSDVTLQEIVALGFVEGALSVNRVGIHIDIDAVGIAVLIHQSHIEADLALYGIQRFAQMVGVDIAELIVGGVILQILIGAGVPVIIGVTQTVGGFVILDLLSLCHLAVGGVLIGKHAGDLVLGDGFAVGRFAFGIHGHVLGGGGVVLHVHVGEDAAIGVKLYITPVDGSAVALLGTVTGGGITGNGGLTVIEGVNSSVVILNGSVVVLNSLVEGFNVVIVRFHGFQILAIRFRTQLGVLAVVVLQSVGLVIQILTLLDQLVILAQTGHGIVIGFNAAVDLANLIDAVHVVGMEVIVQRFVLVLNPFVLAFDALIVVGNIDIDGVFGLVIFQLFSIGLLGSFIGSLGNQIILIG